MIRYQIEDHGYGFPTKVLAGYGGGHQYNIKLTADTDNAMLVGRGDWLGLDLYEQTTTVPTFTGILREQAANGNWYIEVTAATEALFVYDAPVIAEDYNKEFTKLSHFFNEEGKTVRAYSLAKGDIIEVSENLLSGTKTPGKSVSYSNGKYAIAN